MFTKKSVLECEIFFETTFDESLEIYDLNFLIKLIYSSLKNKKRVFIFKKNFDFNLNDYESFFSKHFVIDDNFIFLNYSIKNRVKKKNFQKNESLDFLVLKETLSKVLND